MCSRSAIFAFQTRIQIRYKVSQMQHTTSAARVMALSNTSAMLPATECSKQAQAPMATMDLLLLDPRNQHHLVEACQIQRAADITTLADTARYRCTTRARLQLGTQMLSLT